MQNLSRGTPDLPTLLSSFENLMKRELFFEFILYFLCVAFAGVFWPKPAILTFSYGVISLIALIKWHKRNDLFFYFVAFVLGPVGEAIAVYWGAWHYSEPFYLIPIWLPLLWGISALLIKNISETLSKGRGTGNSGGRKIP